MILYNIFIVNHNICKKKYLFSYQSPSFCIFVFMYLMMALAWAEIYNSIHAWVTICSIVVCVVLDEKNCTLFSA